MSSENPNYNSKEQLGSSVLIGIRGILTISEFIKNPFKPFLFKVALIFWAMCLITILFLKVPYYPLIIEVKNVLIALLPCILGFTIGGYSILIGFTQPTVIDRITGPMEKSNFSLYQLASASIACNILIHAGSLMLAYIIHLIVWIDVHKKIEFTMSNCLLDVINFISLGIILFALSISLFVILQLIANAFNVSQLYHYSINKDKIDGKGNSTAS